jgi:hypothetical protein
MTNRLVLAAVLATLATAELGRASEGETFTATRGRPVAVPETHHGAEVVVEAITGAWVRLAVRSPEGRPLGLPTMAHEGSYGAVFWLGEDEYELRVERVKSHVFRRTEVRLRATPRWSPDPNARHAELEPAWFEALDEVERERGEAARAVERVTSLIDGGELVGARAALEEARQRHVEAAAALHRLRQPTAPPATSTGAAFIVEEFDGAPLPGSRGWLEVVVGAIGRTEAQIGVRTTTGDTLGAPRAVGVGDELRFRLDDRAYAVRVERLIRPFFGGHVHAELRVLPCDGAAVGESAVLARRPRPIDRLDEAIASAAASLDSVEPLIEAGSREPATAALARARRIDDALEQGLLWMRKLRGEPSMREHLCVVEDLSLVRVRVTRVRPEFEVGPDAAGGEDRRARLLIPLLQWAGGIVMRHVFDMDVLDQVVECRILEAPTAGSRYAVGTEMGKRHPLEERGDVQLGKTVEVHLWIDRNSDPTLEGLEEGEEYWLALTPPLALKPIPRKSGNDGRTWVAFAMKATSP